MEEILTKIVSECETCKLTNTLSCCHQAIELIGDRSALLRAPMNDVRHKCVNVFESCFTSGNKNAKLISLAISGLQVMIRQQVYRTADCKEETKQLSSQVIACISSTIQSQKESTQLDMLSLITEMSATIPSQMSLDNIEDIIELCCKLTAQSVNNQMAIETTVSQCCHQFIKYIISSDCSDTNDSDINSIIIEEIIPLLSLIADKLTKCCKESASNSSIAPLLKCVHFILLTIPDNSLVINENIVDFMWKTQIPLLIKLLSTASISHISPKSHHQDVYSQLDFKHVGRGSESLSKIDNINNYKKYIYKVSLQILRLFGAISSLRPVLESLFHRILLYPPVSQRSDALRFIQEILKDCSLVVLLSFEPIDIYGKSQSKDLDLLHIILDSLEECCIFPEISISSLSISCVVTLLRTMQSISNSCGLNAELANRINSLYMTIEDSEFEGFDVRNNKIDTNSNRKRVDFDVLRDRIKGYDAETEIFNMPAVKEKPTPNNNLNKNMKNFKVDSYKSKLSELLKSKSTESSGSYESDLNDGNKQCTESNGESGNNEENKIGVNLNENCIQISEENHSESSGDNQSDKIGLYSIEDMQENNSNANYIELDENQRSVTSKVSSDTEGPEFEDCVEEVQPKSFSIMFNKQDDKKWIQQVYKNSTESAHKERDSARLFIKTLKRFLPKLLSYRSSVEADEALQVFASNYCKELWDQQKHSKQTQTSDDSDLSFHITIVNADGIYISTYSALLLNLKLIQSNFYNNACNITLLTEHEFIDEIQKSGALIYISSFWLAELYQIVLSENLLEGAGYQHDILSNIALINLLTDIDGLDSCLPGAQQLSDYRRLEKAHSSNLYKKSAETEAGHKLVRRLLTAFWDSILGCLGAVFRADCNDLITCSNALNILIGNENNKTSIIKREMITQSLDGLQIAAKLCIQLGLQSRCDTVFQLLSFSVLQTQSISDDSAAKSTKLKRSVIEAIKSRSAFCLHTSHVLSLQVLLSSCLEIGSHCNPCWSYVFKCCQYIIELEHNYYTSRHSSLLTSTRTSLSSLKLIKTSKSNSEFDLNLAPINEIPTGDITSMPGINETESIGLETSINDLIAQTVQSNDSILKDKQLERIIEILSHLVDRLFEDAAQKLNLRSLLSFLSELCLCSRDQLALYKKTNSPLTAHTGKSLLLFRLSDVFLRFSKSGRPLLHFMKCWPVVASYLVETACHTDHSVAKKSISTLHDIINVMLSLHNEMPHFHFNESLFKPFENLLILELCDTDIQELIISSICEFVEGATEDIRSGWRSLFGALRGIHLPTFSASTTNFSELEVERVRQLRVILDIFEAFLHTDNLQVFANAAVDCLLCLLRLIKSTSNDSAPNGDETNSPKTPDLCLVSLKYLHQFSSMLRSMYQMPACPMFAASRLLQACDEYKLIDTNHLSTELDIVIDLRIEMTLDMLDRPVKILHVWYLLIEELTLAIESGPNKHKITAMEILFNMLKTLSEIPGPNFSIYCTNHILLPSLQRWTRCAVNDSTVSSDNAVNCTQSLSSVRHLCGLTADLIVDHITLLNSESNGDLSNSTIVGIDLMLKQSLLVFIECLSGAYPESLSKLSCACIRHILLSCYTHFNNQLWQTTEQCLSIAHRITLSSVHALINAFDNKTTNFFDDLDQIKVITKRDANEDAEQLCRLAQQIFLLDAQKSTAPVNKWEDNGSNIVSMGDDRAFTFLINRTTEDNTIEQLSISYRELVIQLTCHWFLLQTLSSLILKGINPLIPNLHKFVSECQPSKPLLDIDHYKQLLSLLDYSYRMSSEFDERPGLKFLLQKLSRSEVPSNLYQISSLVWSIQFTVNFYICINHRIDEYINNLRQILTDLCDKYAERVELSVAKDNSSIDDICGQSLYFLQASTDELAAIIGADKVIKINTENTADIECDSSSACDNDIKVYNLATDKKIESLKAEYKRFKTQHSPKPPDMSDVQSRKMVLEKRLSSSSIKHTQTDIEKDNEKLIIKDGQAFIALCSELITSAIDLHLSLPSDQFNYLISSFLPSVQTLTIYSQNKQLRTSLSLWIANIATNAITNSDHK